MEQMIPMYSTKNFEDIYMDVETFMADYGNLGLPKTITDDNAQILYYLLYSRYGNSPIANYDENQFKTKLQAVIWQYGPTWEKKLDIQDQLRKLTASELESGTKVLSTSEGETSNTSSGTNSNLQNHAYDPTTSPSTEELSYIDQQTTNKGTSSGTNSGTDSRNATQVYTKGKLNAYGELWELLNNDVTETFIKKFQKLFKQFVRPEVNYIYESEW